MTGSRWVLLSIVIGSAAGCGGPRSVCDLYVVNYDCPTGSQAWSATVNAEVQASQRCEQLGLSRGTPEFATCNLKAVESVQASQRAELQQEREFRLRAFQAMQPVYQPQPYQPQQFQFGPSQSSRPTTTNCMRLSDSVNCTTY